MYGSKSKVRTTVSARKFNGATGVWEDLGVISDSINGQTVNWWRDLLWRCRKWMKGLRQNGQR